MVDGGGGAYLLTWHSYCFSLSSLPTLLPSLPTPNPPDSPLVGCVTFVRGRLRACSGRETRRLVAFGGVSNSDHFRIAIFEFHRSIFYRALKIVKIIIYTLLVTRNISVILF